MDVDRVALLELMRPDRGHFAFESGFHGELRLDLDGLFERPDGLAPMLDALAEALAPLRPQVVVGPLVGGALAGYGVAERLRTGFLTTARSQQPARDGLHPFTYRLAGSPARLRGSRVVVVDDVINAGSAVGGSLDALEQAGAEPVGIAALLVLGDAARRLAAARSLTLIGLAEEAHELWPPEVCPRCASGIPVEPA